MGDTISQAGFPDGRERAKLSCLLQHNYVVPEGHAFHTTMSFPAEWTVAPQVISQSDPFFLKC